MRPPNWVYTALDKVGIRAPKLPECAEACLKGRRTKCSDVFLNCVCNDIVYTTSVEQCIAYQCGNEARHKSSLWFSNICDRHMGWFQDARGNRFFTDFRDIDMREMKLPADFDRLFKLNKRQISPSGSFAFSDVVPQPTATGSSDRTTIDVGDNVITSNLPSGSSTPASQDAASATESSASNLNETGPSSGGLTQAAKIGIGLGVPLGLIVLGALIFGIYWFGKRQGRKKQDEPVAQTQEVTQSVPEADGRPYYGNELWTNSNAAELPGNKAVPGMPQRPPAVELYGDRYRY